MARIVQLFRKAEMDLAGIADSIHISVSRESAKKWIAKLRAAINELS